MEQLQSPESQPSSSLTPEDRLARRRVRRVRRWKRRARIAGPFLGIPLLFAALSLSVDLIEYEPTTEPDRPIDLEAPTETERVNRRVSLTADSVGSVNSVLRDGQRQIVADDVIELDLGIPTRPGTAIPTPPTLMR